MAQNIEIANAQYNDVPSIEVPKQGGGTASFVDTTDADAIASEIDMGKTAYVNGVKLTGTRSGGGGSSIPKVIQDDHLYYCGDAKDKVVIVEGNRTYYKYNGVPAIVGIGKINGYCTSVYLSLSEGGTMCWSSYDSRNKPYFVEGQFYDSTRMVMWYYSVCSASYPWQDSYMNTSNYPRIMGSTGEFANSKDAALALLDEANPTLVDAT